MRPQIRKQTVPDSQNFRSEASNTQNPFEDAESTKLPSKKNVNTINLNDGLPMHTTVEQLKIILTQPASNIGEKAVLLDARDRLIRLRKDAKDKSVGVKKVTTLKGTCLDMCPEKERYSRAEKRRLALYEIIDSYEKDYEVNHKLAVKEYSRSSADQAEPLAHELRPLSVLQMTMDYLIARILDRCDLQGENLAEWFNFLWDRMRGIRKDITQQSLCELGSVDLVEKCARFHIHCTARLCELDMQDFDQKINDENLTKCLQTLKHMYYDLSVKNIFCPNEAEFRSYDVLLHLNDGEILREVLQLRAEVRDSFEVRSALKFVNTLNSRNYVRFFKLTKSNQDYLQCCLLQRYFNQMRSLALQIMVQAYGPPKKGQISEIQLSSLVNILGYEDIEEAALWCEYYGLPIDPVKKVVKFDRSSFIESPEKFPPMRRSSLIENKRTSSVSESIAKGKVPEDPTLYHTPLNSFDSNGQLLKEAWLAEDQGELVKILPSTAVVRPLASAVVTTDSIESISVRIRNQLVNTTVQETVTEMAQQIVAHKKIIRSSSRIFEEYLEEFTKTWCLELINEVISELNTVKRHQEQHKLDLKRKLQFLSNQVYENIVECVIHDQIKSLGAEAIQAASRLRASIMKDKYAHRMLESLVGEIISMESRAVAYSVAREAIETREDMVQRVSELVKKRRIRRWITKWRRFAVLQIRRRKEKQTFPACPSRMVFGQQIISLKSKGESNSSSLKRKSLVEQTVNVKRLNSLSDLRFSLNEINASLEEKVFDLFMHLQHLLPRCPSVERNRCWKLVILTVNCTEDIGELFRKSFGFKTAKRNRNGWVYTETRTTKSSFTLCVRFVKDCENISDFLRGANALLVIFDPLSEINNLLQYVAQLVQLQAKYFPLPVASVASKHTKSSKKDVTQILQPCSHTTITDDEPLFEKQKKLVDICSALVQSGQSSNPPHNQVCISTVWELANDFICRKILSTIYRDLQSRLERGLKHQTLSQLLEFSNRAVQHLIEDIVLDSELSLVNWPAPELVQITDLKFPPTDWNSTDYQLEVQYALEKYLILPSCQIMKENDFPSICDALRKYCLHLSVMETDATAFLSRVDSILVRTKLYLDECLACESNVEDIPWTDIFQACIDYRLQALANKGSAMFTGYFSRALSETRSSDLWVEARTYLESNDASCFELKSAQFKDEENVGFKSNHPKMESLDLPVGVVTVCDAIANTSNQIRQENQRFEEILLRALTPDRRPLKRSPIKQTSAPLLSTEDHLELLKLRLQQSHCEHKNFESFLKRTLDDA